MCCINDRNHRPILTTKTYLFQLLTTLRVAHCHRVRSYHCIFFCMGLWLNELLKSGILIFSLFRAFSITYSPNFCFYFHNSEKVSVCFAITKTRRLLGSCSECVFLIVNYRTLYALEHFHLVCMGT